MTESRPDDLPTEEILKAIGDAKVAAAPLIDQEFSIEIDTDARDNRDAYQFLSRFFGVCVAMIGLITVLPAIYSLVIWIQADENLALPRWIYLVGFIGALHLLYAIYTIQIADYSSLQALAVFLLVFTCLYGFVAAALLLEDGQGLVMDFLQLPTSMVTRAAIWSGIMFCVTAMSCYLFGREAILWRKRSTVNRFE